MPSFFYGLSDMGLIERLQVPGKQSVRVAASRGVWMVTVKGRTVKVMVR